jgi:predicted MPP superfamily phosphohydrolase
MKMFFFLLIITILVLIEFYVFSGLSHLFSPDNQKIYRLVYYLTIFLMIAGISSMFFAARKGFGETSFTVNTLVGIAFSIILGKIIIADFLLVEDIYRFFRLIIEKILLKGNISFVARNNIPGYTALTLSSLFFILCMYGLFFGKYNYKVRHIPLSFTDLPEEFSGFKILQISDIHSGTIDNFSAFKRGIELVKSQNADIILFTGDLVNNFADEIKPYAEILASVSAPFGKYSILGNHDYGHYFKWSSEKAWKANMNKLYGYHDAMGFRLLKNQYVELRKGNDSIILAGVENWGKPPFHQYGDLNKTFENSSNGQFTILMSHDPSHWDGQVLGFSRHINLTLSGHTHGMQLGVEIGRFKWSPVKMMYPKWIGLYENNGRYLYVNRGFGFIGFPARVGIWPEITVIELKKK